tara:strand:- start:4915 stop:5196 length:282 start_codon:yes stop_codon:yes gene_type:complete
MEDRRFEQIDLQELLSAIAACSQAENILKRSEQRRNEIWKRINSTLGERDAAALASQFYILSKNSRREGGERNRAPFFSSRNDSVIGGARNSS